MFHGSVLPHDFPSPELTVHLGALSLLPLASRCLIASFPVRSRSELQLCGKLSFLHIVLNKKTRHGRYLAEQFHFTTLTGPAILRQLFIISSLQKIT